MLTLLLLAHAHAAEVGGYFRLMARPDLVGGDGRLGTSPFYGRLLNEGPWGLLDVRQSLVKGGPDAPWGALTLRVEGGAVGNGDPTNGSLLGFRVSQLYLTAGNLGPAHTTWRFGTLETTFGDLWLYDARPTQMLVDVLGASATWANGGTEVVLGAGDAGWAVRGARYHLVVSAGGSVRRKGEHAEVGIGGQAWYEPADGDPDGPHDTDGLTLADLADPAAWASGHPGPAGHATRGLGWKLAGTFGFGGAGALRWNRLQVIVARRLPDAPLVAEVEGAEVRLGAAALTDQRHELTVGDEVELVLVPDRLELAAAAIFEHRFDPDDRRATSATWRTAASAVVRAQLALTPYVSLLGETSLAREVARGPAAKDTWQGKAGVVLSPAGTGLGARPALRALYGVQRCSLPGAWPGAAGGGRWHQLVSLEAEAWF